MMWVVNTLEEGGNPVHVRQWKPIPLGEHHICIHSDTTLQNNLWMLDAVAVMTGMETTPRTNSG